jgi:hypothetical protein
VLSRRSRLPGARTRAAAAALALLAAAAATTIALGPWRRSDPSRSANERAGAAALAVDLARTRPLGHGAAYRLPARPAAVSRGRAVAGLHCGRPGLAPYGAHVELFVADRVLTVPAGIGWAPPVRSSGARVAGGRCSYPLRTDDPSGLVVVDARRAAPATLGALFTVWGQRLDAHHLAGFSTRSALRAFLDGRAWRADPRAIPLRRHAQVELEIGPPVSPHSTYAFPPGL